jgi:hypothetical protein
MGILGALVGAAIDRRDGQGGIKGAIAGAIAQRATGAALPMLGTLAVGWAVIKAAKFAEQSIRASRTRS